MSFALFGDILNLFSDILNVFIGIYMEYVILELDFGYINMHLPDNDKCLNKCVH